MNTDQLPPHNEASEMGLLGCCILDGANVSKSFDGGIRPEAFYLSAHRVLWRRLRQMDSDQNPIDLITLTQTLRASGELEEVGGAAYLNNCMEQGTIASHADYHIRNVLEAWRLRDVWTSAIKAAQDSVEPGASSVEIVSNLRAKLDSVEWSDGSKSKTAQELTRGWVGALEDRMQATRGGREFAGLPSGFRSLDRMSSGLPLGGLTVIGARPSVGKTALACCLIRHSCIDLGIKTTMFSLETTPERLIDRIAASHCNISATKIRDGEELTEREMSRVSSFGLKLAKSDLRIETMFNCDEIVSAIGRYADSGTRLFIIDYMQIVGTPTRSKNEPRTYAVGSVATALKQAAIKHNVCVVALAQLKRPDNEGSTPSENDLADSDQIFRDADLLWLLHRPDRIEEPEEAVVIVAKSKDGACGVVAMKYAPEFLRFEEQRERPDR